MLPKGWDEASEVYGSLLLSYHAERGADPAAAHVKANVENNTSRVPARGDHLVRMLDELLELDLAHKAVLDIGCGFGALAAYLAWRAKPARLVATDIDEAGLDVARQAARETGLDQLLTFVEADMRDLSPLDAAQFDIVLANGVIFYMASRKDLDRALREMHGVLVPGGSVLFYQSNRWRWTDPFTGAPLVHLLPRRLSAATSRLTGWKSSRARIRLVSPVELRRRLCRIGFERVRIVGFGKEKRHTTGPVRFFGQRYALAARRRD
jgi:ubiquinone/menaquinone biosynthesis C-methylase UbiE